MPGPIQCTVVSPERPLFEGRCERFVVPGSDGELGILPRHAPLIAKLGEGVVRLHLGPDEGGAVEKLAIRGGFLQVRKDVATLLVTDAVAAPDVSAEELRRELEQTIAELQHPPSDEAFRELLRRRRWIDARLSLVE